jgi:hypothetical protein
VLIDIFENNFVRGQEALGIRVVGQFREPGRPDRFTWIRSFPDLPSRGPALNAFYTSAVWWQHREAANATILDSDDVLLLREAWAGSGFAPDQTPPARESSEHESTGLVVANLYYFDRPVDAAFCRFFEEHVRPQLVAAGIDVRATFVTETAPNNYPRLPVREHDYVFAWFATTASGEVYRRSLCRLATSAEWRGISDTLHAELKSSPEELRLEPTWRSRLHG